MRFLVDAQLPPALSRWFVEQGHEADHVFDIGLNHASDREIWAKARETGSIIVSKDEDFAVLTEATVGMVPLLWLRIGNTTTSALLDWLAPLLPGILTALESGERLIEISDSRPDP